MAKGGVIRLKRVTFEYEDGTSIIFNEASDPIIGRVFHETLAKLQQIPSLQSTIIEKSSPIKNIQSKIAGWLKI